MNNIYFLNRTAEKFYLPKIEYTGKYEFIDESFGNWKIRFLESGTLKFIENKPEYLDVFLVGGGSSSDAGGSSEKVPGPGGSGGFTTRGIIKLNSNIKEYEIKIGQGGIPKSAGGVNGEESSAFGLVAKGGIAPNSSNNYIGQGGSGGGGYNKNGSEKYADWTGADGGSNGANGLGTNFIGQGQGFTTREFYESTGILYAGGGGGASSATDETVAGGKGGEGGGGHGSNFKNNGITPGAPNTGGGGGGGNNGVASAGGSGIVVIRNTRYN